MLNLHRPILKHLRMLDYARIYVQVFIRKFLNGLHAHSQTPTYIMYQTRDTKQSQRSAPSRRKNPTSKVNKTDSILQQI